MDEGANDKRKGRRRWVRWGSSVVTSAFRLAVRGVRARRMRRGRALPLASMTLDFSQAEDPELHAGPRHAADADVQDAASSSSAFPLALVPAQEWFGSIRQEKSAGHQQHSSGSWAASRHSWHLRQSPGHTQPRNSSNVPSEDPNSQHGQQEALSIQRLVAAGSRMWGSGSWMDARSLLGVKIYDFSVYVDEAAAARTACTATSSSGFPPPSTIPPHPTALTATATGISSAYSSPHDLLSHVLKSPDVPASIILRAARDLPMDLLHREMARVLERRYVKAGGSAHDPELQQLLACFSAAALPPHLRTSNGAAVRRGATMVFSRAQGGVLAAHALGVLGAECSHVAASAPPMMPAPVHSPVLCEALLDLYLGTDPVSKKAKAAAVTSLQRMTRPLADAASWQAAAQGVVYSPVESQRIYCGGGVSGAEGEGVDGCVLHVP